MAKLLYGVLGSYLSCRCNRWYALNEACSQILKGVSELVFHSVCENHNLSLSSAQFNSLCCDIEMCNVTYFELQRMVKPTKIRNSLVCYFVVCYMI